MADETPNVDYGLSSGQLQQYARAVTPSKPAWIEAGGNIVEGLYEMAEAKKEQKDALIDAEIEWDDSWSQVFKKGEMQESTYNTIRDWCASEKESYLKAVEEGDKKEAHNILMRQKQVSENIQAYKGNIAIGKDLQAQKNWSNVIKNDPEAMYQISSVIAQSDGSWSVNGDAKEMEIKVLNYKTNQQIKDLQKRASEYHQEYANMQDTLNTLEPGSEAYNAQEQAMFSLDEEYQDVAGENLNMTIEEIKSNEANYDIIDSDKFSKLINRGIPDAETRLAFLNTTQQQYDAGLKGKGFNINIAEEANYGLVNPDNIEKLMMDKLYGGTSIAKDLENHPDFDMSYNDLLNIFKNNEDVLDALDIHFKKDGGVENLDKGEVVDGKWVNKADEYMYIRGKERPNPNYDPGFKGDGKVDSEEINAFFGEADRTAIIRAMLERDQNGNLKHYEMARDYIVDYMTKIQEQQYNVGYGKYLEEQEKEEE